MTVNPFNPSDDSAVAAFLSGGNVAAKFPKVGFTVEGTVLSYEIRQRTDIDSGELLFWEGKKAVEQSKLQFPAQARPATQLLIDLQCDPTGITWETKEYIEKRIADDDGRRTLYVNGDLQRAVAKAIKDAGARLPEVGGYLKVTRGESVVRPGAKYPSHTFTAQFTPAASNEKAAEALLDEDDPFAEAG